MITQDRINEIAASAVDEAIKDLVNDRMGLAELLADDLRDSTPEEFAAACDRLEAAISLYLPGDDPGDDNDEDDQTEPGSGQ